MRKTIVLIVILGSFAMGLPVVAADTPAKSASKETRNHMAEMHEKMALCLRSDRPMSECRDEMMGSDMAGMCGGMAGQDMGEMMANPGEAAARSRTTKKSPGR
jgi:hypothetical protein